MSEVVLGRRSAQRFDPKATLERDAFFALLRSLLPSATLPWTALASPPRISLVLFVHRVIGMEPGLYLLSRCAGHDAARLAPRLSPEPVADAGDLPLQRLIAVDPQELRRIARAIHCHQDIAANAVFAMGMLADFAAPLAEDPANYRALFREAGLIGQMLYLEAEALGLRGTGIGCYFDDPFHALLGLPDEALQSLYHFTVGLPVDDLRLQTTIPYPDR